jgi:hypothetical protein
LNAKSAVRIVQRHSKDFPGGATSRVLAYTYLGYTYLPVSVRSTTYALLSRLKKWMFGASK